MIAEQRTYPDDICRHFYPAETGESYSDVDKCRVEHVILNFSNAKHLLISLKGYAALQYLQKQIKD